MGPVGPGYGPRRARGPNPLGIGYNRNVGVSSVYHLDKYDYGYELHIRKTRFKPGYQRI